MKRYYQLKISLIDSKPTIYRRILINPELKLLKLHDVIQIVMGWTNSHLHQFIINNEYYAEPNPDDYYEIINYKNIKIIDILNDIKDKIKYEYDFGDSWLHTISLEKKIESEEKFNVKCIEGKYNCPPEDCGGIGGYYDLLEIINDPKNEEYESMLEWLGNDFDPKYFDLVKVNEELEYLNKRVK